nr:hypothetical protein [Tanacetum cinerariifolium]
AHYGYNCPPKVPIIPNQEPFNNETIKELPPTVPSFDPKSDLVHDSPNVFDPPPQLPFYSCEFCGNDARYGHYCTPQVPNKIFVVKIAGYLTYKKEAINNNSGCSKRKVEDMWLVRRDGELILIDRKGEDLLGIFS